MERTGKSFFVNNPRNGRYYEAVSKVQKLINETNLDVTGKIEKDYEGRIATSLGNYFNNGSSNPDGLKFIDQRSVQQVLTRVTLFDCDHRPDMSIEKDGVAVEVKYLEDNHGSKVREALGQSLVYRNGYRFVVLVLVDRTGKDRPIKKLFEDTETCEYALSKHLEDLGIYVMVK